MMQNIGTTSDTSALSITGAQPVWMTLNEARERAFTGEVVFEADPEVLAYLDNGVVYYAERASDVSLGRRLLDAGLVDTAQLERGTVRVGDVEHLGRLFDRDPSVDRDAVIVLAETSTEDLIADLANRAITTVRVTAYRHHPSGVHRWFVAPLEAASASRPVSAVAQLDTTVVDDLPGLPFAGIDADELTIEWDEPIDGISETDSAAAFTASFFDSFVDEDQVDSVDVGTQAEADVFELTLDHADAPWDIDSLVDIETHDVVALDDSDEFEFAVVWPDGTTEASAYVETDDVAVVETSADLDEVVPAFTQTDDGELQFEMPPLTLSDEPDVADAEVPDDVAEAVRRAIAAIESATVIEAPVATPDVDRTEQIPEVDVDAPIVDALTAVETVPHAAAAFGGFAPPTMAMRAEVLYGQVTNEQVAAETSAPIVGEAGLSSGVASVVFVDDPIDEDSGGDSNDRSSALRRLIGGLRRKDR